MTITVSKAIDDVLDAAVDGAAWSQALDALAESLGAVTGSIIPRDPADVEAGIPHGARVAGILEAYVAGGWHRMDPRAERAWPRYARGEQVLVDHDLASDEERRRLAFFNDFADRHGLPWWGGLSFAADGRLWCFSLQRDETRGPFTRDELAPYVSLAPQLSRAITVAGRLRRSIEQATVDVADGMRSAVVMLGRTGKVTRYSNAAAALLEDPFRLRGDRLEATAPRSNGLLQALIRSAVEAPDTFGPPAGTGVIVERETGWPVLVEAIALPASARDVFSRDVAMLMLRDLDQSAGSGASRVAAHFGLTQTEAAIAARIADGEDLRTISEEQRIAYQTVRVHLRNIFSKTRVSRQSELAVLVDRMRGG